MSDDSKVEEIGKKVAQQPLIAWAVVVLIAAGLWIWWSDTSYKHCMETWQETHGVGSGYRPPNCK